MAEHEAGLHKDVAAIFKEVWDPSVDNVQQSFAPPRASSVAYYMKPAPARRRRREAKLATVARALGETSGHVFSFRSRREKKRLSSISKHLIINNTAG
jgi:hypothetical protein